MGEIEKAENLPVAGPVLHIINYKDLDGTSLSVSAFPSSLSGGDLDSLTRILSDLGKDQVKITPKKFEYLKGSLGCFTNGAAMNLKNPIWFHT